MRDKLTDVTSTFSLTENLAQRIVDGVRRIINNDIDTGRIMVNAIKKATSVALESVRKHAA